MASSRSSIAVVDPGGSIYKHFSELAPDQFNMLHFQNTEEVFNAFEDTSAPFTIICICDGEDNLIESCKGIKEAEVSAHLPVIIAVDNGKALNHVDAFEAGCDDIFDLPMDKAEIILRLNKSIFHHIAQQQLQATANQAREMAFTAMADSSDLGTNIQFLLNSDFCDNLDELGQMLFQSLKSYGVTCSIQMRSVYGAKTMEETGIEKDLEARLLTELKDEGRYVEFGERCVINYGAVSLLIKNMPVGDTRKYDSIKDNLITLVQGTDSRIQSLDAQKSLQIERDFMGKLVNRLKDVMENLDQSYQIVMKQSAELVEDMSMRLDESIMFLDLTEEQERTLENIMKKGVEGINVLFADGTKIDENFHKLVKKLTTVFDSVEEGPSAKMLQEISSIL